ncbi:hypothetical protein [Pseudomonas xanthosomatis]|uniref:hypothetical protein n=1 Tax=Pseudomonas xanthosomatis TaxID=2842356 RepID=UPI00351377D1
MKELLNAITKLEVLTQDQYSRRFPGKTTVGEIVLGMGDLVEVLRKENGLTREKICEIADVSPAGLDRWRKNGYGRKVNCEKLIDYCEQKVRPLKIYNEAVISPNASVAESLRSCSPAQLEKVIQEALQVSLGFPNSLVCTMVKMEAGSDGHRLEILVR